MKKDPTYNESDLKDHMGIWLWIENSQGEILMQYHKKFGCWTIPLEKSDPGESLDDAISRTGIEELGINIGEYEIAHIQDDTYERNGNLVKVRGFLVNVKTYEGIPANKEPEKHTDFGWKSKEFLLDLNGSTDAVKALQEVIK